MDLLAEIDAEDRLGMLRVLDTYRSRQQELRDENPEHDGWVPRISDLADLESEDLSRIHGQLIAWGCLKFQIANRSSGVVYRIGPEGNLMLENRGALESATDSHEEAA